MTKVLAEEKMHSIVNRNAKMRELLSNIVMNASIIPDPAMAGKTDIYSVPTDDIEAAAEFLGCLDYIRTRV